MRCIEDVMKCFIMSMASLFIDFTFFLDESGNGIHFDSDVVFSSKSYLPRSARLAMNVDLFGYAFDLFEVC